MRNISTWSTFTCGENYTLTTEKQVDKNLNDNVGPFVNIGENAIFIKHRARKVFSA